MSRSIGKRSAPFCPSIPMGPTRLAKQSCRRNRPPNAAFSCRSRRRCRIGSTRYSFGKFMRRRRLGASPGASFRRGGSRDIATAQREGHVPNVRHARRALAFPLPVSTSRKIFPARGWISGRPMLKADGGGYRMRLNARRGSGKRVWAVVAGLAVATLVLIEPRSDAHAQRFDDAISKALDAGCDGLAGPKRGGLDAFCGGSGPVGPGVGASTGASIAAQTVREQGADERRIRLRLEEQRQARGDGGVRAASSDSGFQLGKLGVFLTA